MAVDTTTQADAIVTVETHSPAELRRRVDRLIDKREDRNKRSQRLAKEFARLNRYLDTADKVTEALRQLNDKLLKELLDTVQDKLTVALQEIIDQPIKLLTDVTFKNNGTWVDFAIDRNGNEEDIMRGQGGSVANVLSVGLRMFALTTLDEQQHRRFLVLDEQDCWLRPDLVPRLVKIVRDAADALGFQVLMISHHDVELFEQYADRIYQLQLGSDGAVKAELFHTAPENPDP